ncbi:MAG: YcxB family protein [Erythrobacter sp.]
MEPVSYTISKEDHFAFWARQFSKSIRRFVIIVAGVVVVLGSLAWFLSDWTSAVAVVTGGCIGAVLFPLIMRYLVLPREAQRTWDAFALIKEEMTIDLGEERFTITQPSAHVDAKWSDMTGWDEVAGVFAVYVTRNQAYVIPKSQVPASHIDYARERLIANGFPKAGVFGK